MALGSNRVSSIVQGHVRIPMCYETFARSLFCRGEYESEAFVLTKGRIADSGDLQQPGGPHPKLRAIHVNVGDLDEVLAEQMSNSMEAKRFLVTPSGRPEFLPIYPSSAYCRTMRQPSGA